MGRTARLLVCGVVTAMVVLACLFLPPYVMRVPRARRDVSHLAEAIVQYHRQFTNFPPETTTGNSDLVAALDRDNPWGMPFISVPSYDRGPDGSFVDPWNQPYQFLVADRTNVTVWSNGPDALDQRGQGDDIVVRTGIQPPVSQVFLIPRAE